ncbi:hypothetical protein [Halarcobacter anaerophilus]|uniref:Uncharacterized protein n=1 Tax=Halarcobacter anaerophilus TaxID=877500 RepID=A0A4Q0XX97_9BACT|nr:hypothetical protein [Halarcobacter anaerophilus]QDF28459.1 hypothetical protein AANAER_0969 [Halarcobacter anaerophilus]RXJ61314.1 hypothetical protein CRV06_14180 [Halarcobacter anaerophilus]
MGILKKIINYIAKASIPTYKFENNRLCFKLKNNDFYEYPVEDYDIKTRHDPYIIHAYTLKTKELFLEYIKDDQNTQWNGQALSLYEGFIKDKLKIKELTLLEKKEIDNYLFKIYEVDESFIIHIIYIFSSSSNTIIIDAKGDLYKNLRQKLENEYKYKYEEKQKGEINFDISLVKENNLGGYFGYQND